MKKLATVLAFLFLLGGVGCEDIDQEPEVETMEQALIGDFNLEDPEAISLEEADIHADEEPSFLLNLPDKTEREGRESGDTQEADKISASQSVEMVYICPVRGGC